MGIGQELRGDDAAGPRIARGLLRRQRARSHALSSDSVAVLIVEGGPAPENCTGPIRRFAPDLVILVDAAHMDETPGTIRWLDWRDTTGLSASTHTLPPHLLARFLTSELGCRVILLGIQPLQTELSAPLSEPVRTAVGEVVAGLTESLWGSCGLRTERPANREN